MEAIQLLMQTNEETDTNILLFVVLFILALILLAGLMSGGKDE